MLLCALFKLKLAEQGRPRNQKMSQTNQHNHKWVAFSCAAFALSMVGVAYAAVPLYKIFCQVTGYGGTTQVAEQASDVILSKKIKVRFDANTSRDLGWSFKPVQREIILKIGETRLAHYQATNDSDERTVGTATFNVTPLAAGAYFNKIACFCFTEQALEPGQTVDMPVSFFIDPDIVNDKDLDGVSTITLSYTFFPLKSEKAKTTGIADTAKSKG